MAMAQEVAMAQEILVGMQLIRQSVTIANKSNYEWPAGKNKCMLINMSQCCEKLRKTIFGTK